MAKSTKSGPLKAKAAPSKVSANDRKLEFLRESTALLRGFVELQEACEAELKSKRKPRPMSRLERSRLTKMLGEIERGFEELDGALAEEDARHARERRGRDRSRNGRVA